MGGEALGRGVDGHQEGGNGNVGQAADPESAPVQVDVQDMPFKQRSRPLRDNSDRLESCISFLSGVEAAQATLVPGDATQKSQNEKGKIQDTISGECIAPTVPNPESRMVPRHYRDGVIYGGQDLKAEKQPAARLEWVLRLLGMSGLDKKTNDPPVDAVSVGGEVTVGAGRTPKDTKESARGIGANFSDTFAVVSGSSQAIDEIFGESGAKGGLQSLKVAIHPGEKRVTGIGAGRRARVSTTAFHASTSDHSQQTLVHSTATTTALGPGLSDNENDELPENASPLNAGDVPVAAQDTSHVQRQHPESASFETLPNDASGRGAGPLAHLLAPTAHIGRDEVDIHDNHTSLSGLKGSTDQSLDTVSLLSEVSAFAKDEQSLPRVMSSIWGGGQIRGDSASHARVSEESELEAARRLARTLAAKLKERTRRCEELEYLSRLRDEQILMLQRQSNALAVHAVALKEKLDDKTALAEALQSDRSRLNQELDQALLFRSAGEAGRDTPLQVSAHMEELDVAQDPGKSDTGNAVDAEQTSSGETTAVTVAASEGKSIARAIATAVAAAEEGSNAAIAAAEERSLALREMVDSVVGEKVQWEEQRAASAHEVLKMRARMWGLEEAVLNSRAGDGVVGDCAHSSGGPAAKLKELLKERTRELEEKAVANDRLAARIRELEGQARDLRISLLAREQDLFATDKQMLALSTRLNAELQESNKALAKAEAVLEERKRGLEATKERNVRADGASRNVEDDDLRTLWAEERARLQHNLLSLKKSLEDREARGAADERAATLRYKAAEAECDRFAREVVSLRRSVDSLRVEVAVALTAAAASKAPVPDDGKGGKERVREDVSSPLPSEHSAPVGQRKAPLEEAGVGVGHGEPDWSRASSARFEVSRDSVQSVGDGELGDPEVEKSAAIDEPGEETGEASVGMAEGAIDEAEPGGSVDSRGLSDAIESGRDMWLNGDHGGSSDELRLNLAKKDMVIEQLRSQLKQVQSKVFLMEEEHAVNATAPQGLPNQLGVLEGTVLPREERKQEHRNQAELLGRMGVERLKGESVAGASAESPLPLIRQTDPTHAQHIENRHLQRRVDDLQWDLRTLKLRIEEREMKIRSVRAEADSIGKRARDTERGLTGALGEAAIASMQATAERRRADACQTEIQSLYAEMQSERERSSMAMEEQRLRLEAESRGRVSQAVARVEAGTKGRAEAAAASLRAMTMEREELQKEREIGLQRASRTAEEITERARELETLRCAVAARDVELDAVVDATAEFSHAVVDKTLDGSSLRDKGKALRCAFAAVTETRRALRVVSELEKECSTSKEKIARLREALKEEQDTKDKVAAARAATASVGSCQRSPQGNAEGADRGFGTTPEARADKKRAQEAEDALQKALAGAEKIWCLMSSSFADNKRINGDSFQDDLRYLSHSLPWQPASDPELGALVTVAEALVVAHRHRGDALRRAAVAARAKAVCIREARRREATQVRMRVEAERRLKEALIAAKNIPQNHQEHSDQDGEGAQQSRLCLSPAQEEHLRLIKSEVDRLEAKNRALRRSLGEEESGPYDYGAIPIKRRLFSRAVGGTEEGRSDIG